jgi:ABC-2 type transport system permease protein
MTLAAQYAGAVLATLRRDLIVMLSYRLRCLTQIMTLLFTLTMFYYVSHLVRPDAVGPHGRYYAFVAVGMVISTVLTSALTLSEVIRMELMQGNFERMLVSPLGPVAGVIAVAAFPILYATVVAGVMLTLAVAIFGVPIDVAGIPPALAVGVLIAFAFTGIGLLFVAGMLAFKSGMGASWVIAGLSLLGGAYFPIRLFPSWIRWVSDVQPFTPAVDVLRHLLVNTPTLQPMWLELLKLGGWTAVLMPVSAVVLRFAVNASRRRGTIMEF